MQAKELLKSKIDDHKADQQTLELQAHRFRAQAQGLQQQADQYADDSVTRGVLVEVLEGILNELEEAEKQEAETES